MDEQEEEPVTPNYTVVVGAQHYNAPIGKGTPGGKKGRKDYSAKELYELCVKEVSASLRDALCSHLGSHRQSDLAFTSKPSSQEYRVRRQLLDYLEFWNVPRCCPAGVPIRTDFQQSKQNQTGRRNTLSKDNKMSVWELMAHPMN